MDNILIELPSDTTISDTRWQAGMKNAIRDSNELLSLVGLSAATEPYRLELSNHHQGLRLDGNSSFPLFVTREFAERINKGDWNDPLLQQVWIDAREAIIQPGFAVDPVGDKPAEVAPGLLQKYFGRVLMITTGACAIHCRYCFRRHYPYSTAPKSIDDWQPALEYIEANTSIKEVILSGGDPLTIVDSTLSKLVARLDRIEHLERLRIHTRLPIVLPQRVDDALLEWLKASRLSTWIVLHVNHAQEVDENVAHAVARLRSTGAVILNQAVLLKGINDSTLAQESLCRRLLQMSVLPYYLNILDQVQGASHFNVPIATGQAIIAELAKILPGYGVPRLVQEQAGQPNKTKIG
jgi:EF-P beta-lysylation protein EpmB